MNPPAWLLQFKRDEFSQTGEDGILEKINSRNPAARRPLVCRVLTNTRHLIQAKGFSSVLIEADQSKFAALRRNYSQSAAKVTTMNRFVGFADEIERKSKSRGTGVPLNIRSSEMASNAPEELRTDLGSITYLFSGYDGKVFLRGGCKLPWHALDLKESDVQPLPAFLRKFPGNTAVSREQPSACSCCSGTELASEKTKQVAAIRIPQGIRLPCAKQTS